VTQEVQTALGHNGQGWRIFVLTLRDLVPPKCGGVIGSTVGVKVTLLITEPMNASLL